MQTTQMVILKGRAVIRLDDKKRPYNKILFSFKSILILLTNQNQILFCLCLKFPSDYILLFEKAVPRNPPPCQVLSK